MLIGLITLFGSLLLTVGIFLAVTVIYYLRRKKLIDAYQISVLTYALIKDWKIITENKNTVEFENKKYLSYYHNHPPFRDILIDIQGWPLERIKKGISSHIDLIEEKKDILESMTETNVLIQKLKEHIK